MQFIAEDDVLYEHALDLDTPSRGNIFDNFTDGLCNLFTALDHILQYAGANNVSQRCLRALDKCLANIADAESSLVRRYDMIVNDRGEVEGDVVLCHADLTGYFDDLDLDINLDEALRERVDLNQSRIHGAVEAPEFGDKADVSLRDGLVWIRAEDAARDCTTKSKQGAEVVYCDDGMSIVFLRLWSMAS